MGAIILVRLYPVRKHDGTRNNGAPGDLASPYLKFSLLSMGNSSARGCRAKTGHCKKASERRDRRGTLRSRSRLFGSRGRWGGGGDGTKYDGA
jgi:hypothetical protein